MDNQNSPSNNSPNLDHNNLDTNNGTAKDGGENGAVGIQMDHIKIEDKRSPRGSELSNNDKDSRRPSSKNNILNNNSGQGANKMEKQNIVDVFQIEEQEEEKKCPFLEKILDNTIFNFGITMITVYALFGDDIRVLGFNKKQDIYFDVVTIIALVMFTAEITMSVFSKPGYKFSFFFWLDILSTLSLVLDIQIISNAIFFQNQAANTANLARAGRASRVGTKAGRVVRLVRLIRIVKLYKASTDIKTQKKNIEQRLRAKRDKKAKNKGIGQEKQRKSEKQANYYDDSKQEEKKQEEEKESRVSKKLSDLTTKRVIVIVLSLLFIMPLFNSDYYFDLPRTVQYQTKILRDFSQNKSVTIWDVVTTYQYLLKYGKGLKTETVLLNTPFGQYSSTVYQGYTTYQNKFKDFSNNGQLDILRQNELDSSFHHLNPSTFCTDKKQSPLYINDGEEQDLINRICDEIKGEKASDSKPNKLLSFKIQINIKSVQIFNAGLSLGRTVFVCIVLTMGALLFSKDANDLALRPIERMINKVNQIARNPNDAKNQDVIEEKGKDQYETVVIENAITKIGTLLALGFGDAGSEIIGSNMQRVGDVDPLIPGKKKICVYGFCDIRNFTDATEQLQEDVMLFVNNIGGVVHNMVDRFLGAANKNIGDAFLLVWKLPDDKVDISEDNTIEYKDPRYVSVISDFAVLSFMKIQAKINREPSLLLYRKDQRLLERFPDYKVRIGYGLHIGWSIEGAIGSEFKIDASYLSPNVKMSERLEGTTKSYGVPLLISEDLYNRLSEEMKVYVRRIDRLLFKGSQVPLSIYTIDMQSTGLPQSKHVVKEKDEIQIDNRLKRDEIKDQLLNDHWSADAYIKQNKDIKLIVYEPNIYTQYVKQYNEAMDNYEQGNWQQAKQLLEAALPLYQKCVAQQVIRNEKLIKDKEQNLNGSLAQNEENRNGTSNKHIGSKNNIDKQNQKSTHANENSVIENQNTIVDNPTQVIMEYMEKFEFICPPEWQGYRLMMD